MCVCVYKLAVSHNSSSSIRMGYLLVVLAVPVVAQNNRSLSCPSAVGQVSKRMDQLVNGFAVESCKEEEVVSHLSLSHKPFTSSPFYMCNCY